MLRGIDVKKQRFKTQEKKLATNFSFNASFDSKNHIVNEVNTIINQKCNTCKEKIDGLLEKNFNLVFNNRRPLETRARYLDKIIPALKSKNVNTIVGEEHINRKSNKFDALNKTSVFNHKNNVSNLNDTQNSKQQSRPFTRFLVNSQLLENTAKNTTKANKNNTTIKTKNSEKAKQNANLLEQSIMKNIKSVICDRQLVEQKHPYNNKFKLLHTRNLNNQLLEKSNLESSLCINTFDNRNSYIFPKNMRISSMNNSTSNNRENYNLGIITKSCTTCQDSVRTNFLPGSKITHLLSSNSFDGLVRIEDSNPDLKIRDNIRLSMEKVSKRLRSAKHEYIKNLDILNMSPDPLHDETLQSIINNQKMQIADSVRRTSLELNKKIKKNMQDQLELKKANNRVVNFQQNITKLRVENFKYKKLKKNTLYIKKSVEVKENLVAEREK